VRVCLVTQLGKQHFSALETNIVLRKQRIVIPMKRNHSTELSGIELFNIF